MTKKQKAEEGEWDDVATLVAAVMEGNREAEAYLVRKYGEGLMYVIKRDVRNPIDAEDIYQECFRIIIERLRASGLRRPVSLSSFILGVAKRLIMAHWRAQLRETSVEDCSDLCDDASLSPCDEAICRQESRLLYAALDNLTMPRDREVLRRYLLGMDNQSICDSLGINADQLKKVMYRARCRLRKTLARIQNRERMRPTTVAARKPTRAPRKR